MRTKLLTLFVLLSVVSCQKAIIKDEKPLAEENLTNSRYAISKEAALENLEQFLSNDNASVKSSDIRIVKSIVPIKCPSNITKGQSDEDAADNLLYVANFEQNRGYAILAGDNRIKDKVIAVVEDGQLSEATMYSAMSRIGGIPPLAYPGYPAEGEGFFTTPETGDEVFMNPNTVNLYDETVDDTLVGNFEVEEDTARVPHHQRFLPFLSCLHPHCVCPMLPAM